MKTVTVKDIYPQAEHMPQELADAFNLVRTKLPGVTRVVFWGDTRWCYSEEDVASLGEFPDEWTSVLEKAQDAVCDNFTLPAAFEVNQDQVMTSPQEELKAAEADADRIQLKVEDAFVRGWGNPYRKEQDAANARLERARAAINQTT